MAAALPAVPLVPAVAVLAVLIRIPLVSGPSVYRRRWAWVALSVCGLWWLRVAVSATSGAGVHELARIAGWCLVLLACLQILSLGRGGSRVLVAWSALGATWLLSGPGWSGSVLLLAQGAVALESLRAAEGRTWRRPSVWVRWVAALLLTFGIVAGQRAWGPGHGAWGRSAWKESPSRVKGFSVVSRLGSFGPSYLPDREREVAVRVWTSQPPRLLKGMVHDLYSKGSWVASRRASYRQTERMVLDFSQFCREISDAAQPLAWATSPDEHLPVLFAPFGTGCVGVVADSLRVSDAGVFLAPTIGASRGWTWYATDGTDTATVPSDLRVPHELEGLLDSVWREIDSTRGGPSDSASARVAHVSGWMERSFRYDLDVPWEPENDPLRTFVRTRRGYCEYYASLSVLLLRRSGIPARYVTGLSAPEPTSDGASWIYRQGGAHAWVEWRGSDGNWRTLDPTPPGADSTRVADLASRVTETVGGWMTLGWHVLRDGDWRSSLDRWQEMWDDAPDGAWLVFVVFAIAVAGIWSFRTSKRVRSAEGWEGVLERSEAILRRQGQVRKPDETVRDFLARLPAGVDAKARESLELYQTERWKPGEGLNQ